jgi:hypothetical protein
MQRDSDVPAKELVRKSGSDVPEMKTTYHIPGESRDPALRRYEPVTHIAMLTNRLKLRAVE